MLAAASLEPLPLRSWLVDAPHSLNAMSWQGQKAPHRDGFGYAYCDENGRMRVHRWGTQALEKAGQGLPGNLEVRSRTVLAHVRKASTEFRHLRGAVHAHPVVHPGLVLAHNGTVRDAHALDPSPGTDTQKLVRWLAQKWSDGTLDGLSQALAELLRMVRDYTAINLLLVKSKSLFALCLYRQDPQYYTLHWAQTPRAVVVASEPVDPSWGWQPMANGELLEVGPDLTVSRRLLFP